MCMLMVVPESVGIDRVHGERLAGSCQCTQARRRPAKVFIIGQTLWCQRWAQHSDCGTGNRILREGHRAMPVDVRVFLQAQAHGKLPCQHEARVFSN